MKRRQARLCTEKSFLWVSCAGAGTKIKTIRARRSLVSRLLADASHVLIKRARPPHKTATRRGHDKLWWAISLSFARQVQDASARSSISTPLGTCRRACALELVRDKHASRCSSNRPTGVRGDGNQLMQVLQHISTIGGRHGTAKGGVLTIKTIREAERRHPFSDPVPASKDRKAFSIFLYD